MADNPKRVLVVDDDVVVLRLVREALGALVACEVETTPNPEYAFELILKKPFDLMIFDFAMPRMDGALLYSLVFKLYTIKPPHASTKLPSLLLMTGHGSEEKVRELLREPGVHGMIPKPFSIERLLEKVRELIA